MYQTKTPTTPHIRPIPKKRWVSTGGERSLGISSIACTSKSAQSPVPELIQKMKQPMIPAVDRKFAPVHDVEGYVNALMYHGISEEQAAVIRKEHCEALAKFDKMTSEPKKELNVPKVVMPVNTLLEVTGDKVKLILSTGMWKMYEEYFSKAKRPPVGKYLRALKNANYPVEKLNQVVKQYEWFETWQGDAYDEEFERLFPTTGSKKSAVVKKALKAVKKF